MQDLNPSREPEVGQFVISTSEFRGGTEISFKGPLFWQRISTPFAGTFVAEEIWTARGVTL